VSLNKQTSLLPQLVLNDTSRLQKVRSCLQRELLNCVDFRFYVAFATQEGVICLIQELEDRLKSGIRGRILVSQYLNFTQPKALKTLKLLTNLDVRVATTGSVHAKGYFFLQEDEAFRYLIGSSNLTATALTTNTELNVLMEASPGSQLAREIDREFEVKFAEAEPLTDEFIKGYEQIYAEARAKMAALQLPELVPDDEVPWDSLLAPDEVAEYVRDIRPTPSGKASPAPSFFEKTWIPTPRPQSQSPLSPNSMQLEALASLAKLRSEGKTKALVISATGTGKTYLSAFDARAFGAERLLFVVHRENIARAAMKSFCRVFGLSKTYGLVTGNERNLKSDFLFCTVQTLSRPENLRLFEPSAFDYIVLDESHRAGASSYERFLGYFRPKFLLGMTATPERTDGRDIFQHFDHNIGYEIRLHRALDEGMLCPFHYFGVTDITVDGHIVDDLADFNLLTSRDRLDRILEKANLYGTFDGVKRGLVFCSRVEEARRLSEAFNRRGHRSLALDGSASDDDREQAIRRLEDDPQSPLKLDYLFTVDIFNEGVDIPSCNQIILLRPTQSVIVFVQQLGRGLRKTDNEDKYLTVIDFIGNYNRNFLIPLALFGDRSYDKDRMRRLMVEGSEGLPGTSTVSFDRICRDRIFDSINKANTGLMVDLKADYEAMANRLGRQPMMMDFLEHDSRDPCAFATSQGSFHAFARKVQPQLVGEIPAKASKMLQIYSRYILNGVSIEEPLLLSMLLERGTVSMGDFAAELYCQYNLGLTTRRWNSVVNSLNLGYICERFNGPLTPVGVILGLNLLTTPDLSARRTRAFDELLEVPIFERYLRDLQRYAVAKFCLELVSNQVVGGFVRYRKYARTDVFRILGAKTNPVALNVGGYQLDTEEQEWCAVFLTYHKHEGISATTRYNDAFLDRETVRYASKNKQTMDSPGVKYFFNAGEGQRLPLFVKKSDDEGTTFYYIGDMRPIHEGFKQTTMSDGEGGQVAVVEMTMRLDCPVEEGLYGYLTA
jgi:superfamily II DNA or RNA helicase/HKD family nuclease